MAENDNYGLHEKNKLPFGKLKNEIIDPKIIAHQLTMISKDILTNDIKKYLSDNISQDIYASFEKAYAKKIGNIIQTQGNFMETLIVWKDQNDKKVYCDL